MGLNVKVFEVQLNGAITQGKTQSLINAVKFGCDFKVADSDNTHYGDGVAVNSVWSCNSIYTVENVASPLNNTAVCNTYQFAGGQVKENVYGWPDASEFRSNFYAINALPNYICTTDFQINSPEVFGGINNSCGLIHSVWYTDPICYYAAQTGKYTSNIELAISYIAGEAVEIV